MGVFYRRMTKTDEGGGMDAGDGDEGCGPQAGGFCAAKPQPRAAGRGIRSRGDVQRMGEKKKGNRCCPSK